MHRPKEKKLLRGKSFVFSLFHFSLSPGKVSSPAANGRPNNATASTSSFSFLVVDDARASDTGEQKENDSPQNIRFETLSFFFPGSYRCASEAGESEPTNIHIINGELQYPQYDQEYLFKGNALLSGQ